MLRSLNRSCDLSLLISTSCLLLSDVAIVADTTLLDRTGTRMYMKRQDMLVTYACVRISGLFRYG